MTEEKSNTTVEATVTNNQPTEFDLTDTVERIGKAKVKGHEIHITHTLRRASLSELQDRDMKNPYRSQQISENEERILSDTSGKVDVKLYDKLIVSTKGYALNVSEGMTSEQRKAALAKIPPQHKTQIVRAILQNNSEVIFDDENSVEDVDVDTLSFSWGDSQTYRVRTEIGDTGNFVVYSTMREPSQKQIDEYNNSNVFSIEKNVAAGQKPVTKITVSLASAVKLFDELVDSIEGFKVGDTPFDAKNPSHLALVDPYLKRSVIDKVMRETSLDLGE